MVAHQYFENQSEPAAPPPYPPPEGAGNPSPSAEGEGNRNPSAEWAGNANPSAQSVGNPSATPPKKRFGRGLLVAVAALTVAGGAGSGALTAALIDHGTVTASASTALPTTQTSTNSTASTPATTIYKQDSPGGVTLTVNLSNGQAIGSGIVLDTRGDIVTNAHVIAGARTIEVAFSDGTTATATLVGSNTAADLAVIRVSVAASTLHPLTLGSSASVQIGDSVYAIGSPFGLSGSLTEGIVSDRK